MNNRSTSRQGFTLFELITAVAASGLLVVGMSSTLFITMRAVDPSTTPAVATLSGLNILSELAGELQLAKVLTEQTATAITVTVPDRDENVSPETIRYAWSGTPGAPLTRQYNNGSVVSVVSDVHNFVVDYHQPASDVEYVNIHLQVTNDPRTAVETAIPLLNRP